MKKLAMALMLGFAFDCSSASAQLVHAWVDLNDRIVIGSIGELHAELAGLDVVSDGGYLSLDSPAPFQITLLDTPRNVVVGNLGTGVTLDESIVTGLRFNFDSAVESGTRFCADVALSWGSGVLPADQRQALPGDANLDAKVSLEDFLILSTNFNEAGTWPDGDFDCDRLVGFTDFLFMSTNFGREQDLTPPVVISPFFPVPEPIGNVLAMVALAVWVSQCRGGRARRMLPQHSSRRDVGD